MIAREGKKIFILLILSICFILLLTVYSVNAMKSDYFKSIGRRASGIAVITAENITLTNKEVERLMSLDFGDLLNDPVNIKFEEQMRVFMKEVGTKYIYLIHKLPSEKVKYRVNSEEVGYYNTLEGAALDTMYLLDAVIDHQTRLEDTGGNWYKDKDRYTFLHQDISQIYDQQEVKYVFYNDEWGTYLTGFAPVYSVEGDYIGLLGVDIYMDEYMALINKRIIIFIIFNIISILMAVILFSSIKKMYANKKDADHFKEKSYLDDMTGFFNRRTLNERSKIYWQKAIDKNLSITIMMIDIDRFKSYNDKYGHMVGDKMISKVTSAIKLCTRDNVDLLFRYGGDEFMILFFGTEVSDVELIAQRIREHVRSILIKDVYENVTLSFGIASTHPNEESDLNQLINNADKALYTSKQQGRDCINIYGEVVSNICS